MPGIARLYDYVSRFWEAHSIFQHDIIMKQGAFGVAF